jgi:DNA invertase Pin-like site-specific DNA recombinase
MTTPLTWNRQETKDARANDIIVVWKLDRLGRSVRHVLNTFFELEEKGARVRVITQPLLDTSNTMGRFFVAVMAAFAEMEKDFIRERTRAGLAAAKLRGRVGGRESLCTDAEILAVKHLGTALAQKRIGFKTKAAYLRRLAAAEARLAEQPKQEIENASE